jgi:hypothetical protein
MRGLRFHQTDLEDHHPTGFTYNPDLAPDYPGYEWLPEPDENGRVIYRPHRIEKFLKTLNHDQET